MPRLPARARQADDDDDDNGPFWRRIKSPIRFAEICLVALNGIIFLIIHNTTTTTITSSSSDPSRLSNKQRHLQEERSESDWIDPTALFKSLIHKKRQRQQQQGPKFEYVEWDDLWNDDLDDYEKYGLCQGDCWEDDDYCDDGLSCVMAERDDFNHWACAGRIPWAWVSYCVPPDEQPTLAPTREMVPFVPGAYEPDFDVAAAEIDYLNRPVAAITGNNNDPKSSFPLGRCEGDCDSDNECDWGLVCHHRDDAQDDIPWCDFPQTPNDKEMVPTTVRSVPPGWQGGRFGRQDFCVPFSNDNILPGAFRLKMYWEDGYVWQNDTREMFFCMTSHYRGYYNGPCCRGKCWYGNFTEPCRSDQVYIERCIGSPLGQPQSSYNLLDEQQAFRFLKVSDLEEEEEEEEVAVVSRRQYHYLPNVLSTEEVLIQSAHRLDQRCLERFDREIYLAKCNYTNPFQRWSASNGTTFFNATDNRFEISQRGYSKQCLASAHHPKSGEVVEVHFCEALRANDSQTAYWTRY